MAEVIESRDVYTDWNWVAVIKRVIIFIYLFPQFLTQHMCKI